MMQTTAFRCLLWCLVLMVGIAGGCAAPGELTADERRLAVESFETVWTTVREKHWDPEMEGIDWDGVREELKPRVHQARNHREVRFILNEMLQRLGDSHYGVFGPEADEEAPVAHDGRDGGEARENKGPKTQEVGIDLRVLGDACVVTRIEPDSPAEKAGVGRGWIVKTIDGREVANAISNFSSRPPSPSNGLYLTMTLKHRLKGRRGEEKEFTFLDGNDREVNVSVAVGPPRGKATRFGNMGRIHVWCESRRIEGDVGYIRLSGFFDPVTIMSQVQEAIGSFQDCSGVIVDVRGNPGGIGIMASGLAGWFIEESGTILGRMALRSGEMKFAVFPRAETFNGPVAVLVDCASASTSEIFAAGMKDLERARVFGTTSAGAALPSVVEVLPNGDRFQYAIADCWSANGTRIEGVGVVPHQVVEHSRQLLVENRDAVIEAAVGWIREKKKDN